MSSEPGHVLEDINLGQMGQGGHEVIDHRQLMRAEAVRHVRGDAEDVVLNRQPQKRHAEGGEIGHPLFHGIDAAVAAVPFPDTAAHRVRPVKKDRVQGAVTKTGVVVVVFVRNFQFLDAVAILAPSCAVPLELGVQYGGRKAHPLGRDNVFVEDASEGAHAI